ncbi:transglutaminase-like cysteine peptidase [uncultured Ruegeria sp.]|uniref:transglutaminase-like cysteine peptidase n=1 Tax=uncultured Ruegeria sp. TaxID=259304 RepID=UPI00261E0910|nr:transglutaminase-like cysteine peptidase [uncultured Ruegeria sp.]
MTSYSTKLSSGIGHFVRTSGRATGLFALVLGSFFVGSEAKAFEKAFITTVAASPPPSGAHQLCRQYSWACSSKRSISLTSQQEMQIIRQVNRRVNATTREVADQLQYKTRERWALPTSRGGDCEDFALLKKRDLIKAGIDPKKLLIATVLDRSRNGHAVLVYRSANGDLILDNATSRIKPWADTRYLFLRMQDPNQPRRWVGVYGSS